MKCTKSMLTIGAGLFAVLAIAYVALPQFQTFVLSLAPFLLFLLCPLSMMFMMKGMNSHQDHRDTSDTNALQRSRSEEHTSELQSLMRISYAVCCLKKNRIPTHI